MNIFSFHTILVDVYPLATEEEAITLASFRTIFVDVYH